MISSKHPRSIPVAAAILGACLCAVLLLTHVDPSAARKAYSYKVVVARLDVKETARYTSDSVVSWNGDAHHHDAMQEEGELPPLPTVLPRAGGHVIVQTDVIVDGEETQIDGDGSKDPCSKLIDEKDTNGLVVKVKPHGEGKLKSIWTIPHGFSSPNCGFLYDQFPSKFQQGDVVSGDIGDKRVVVTIDGSAKRAATQRHGNITQQLKWTGKVVLVRHGPR
jgi:hypothetical protein